MLTKVWLPVFYLTASLVGFFEALNDMAYNNLINLKDNV